MSLDNSRVAEKLALRRWALRQFHPTPPRVLDLCAGQQVIWGMLRQEFTIASYAAFDRHTSTGRHFHVNDSVRVARSAWIADVVDIDTYGEPWPHWLAVLERGLAPLTVFLTVGYSPTKISTVSKCVHRALGLGAIHVPPAMSFHLMGLIIRVMLHQATRYGYRFRLWTIPAGDLADYYAVRLERA